MDRDEGPRPNTTIEGLAKLQPVLVIRVQLPTTREV